MEWWEVVTVDIPGAFMQSGMEGPDTHMKLEGEMVEILSKLYPTIYIKYKTTKKGKLVMYVKLKKALYGMIKAAMLFLKNLSKRLINWEFEINPYEWCAANKEVNGTQLTVVWHVDDLKISHKDPLVIQSLVDDLSDIYGKCANGDPSPLSIHTGKKHKYLGMLLDYSVDGKVTIDMRDYLNKVLIDLPEEFHGNATTPLALIYSK